MTQSIDWQAVDDYIEAHIDDTIALLKRLVDQPSISAQNIGIDACADLVAAVLSEHGLDGRVLPTDGYPLVYGAADGTSDRTLLLYLHYDVQPPEPLELWQSPPFALTRRDGKLFGRGATDDKGHIAARLAALAALRHVHGALPCRVKLVIEGEEEIGSPSIDRWVRANRELIAADACIWEAGGVDHSGWPTQALGLRGIWYIELFVETAAIDIHSGLGGSIFPNAAWRLVWALSTIKGADERILLPGFYDDVVAPSARDLALLAELPDHADQWRQSFGLTRFLDDGLTGADLRRQAVFAPSCSINGLTAGYQGVGGKTILPARAGAKLDFRLVPNQQPETVARQLRAHLDAHGFSDVQIRPIGGYPAAKVDPDHPFVRLTTDTAFDVYGQPSVIEPMVGGSGPMASFVDVLGVPVVMCGVGYPDSAAHAPNEHVRIDDLVLGIKHTARIIGRFATGS